MLMNMARKLLNTAFDRPLKPMSEDEKKFLSDLRSTFIDLPVLGTKNKPPSEVAWLNNINRLRELVLNQDPRHFLRWDVVSQTMFISFASYILIELKYLKSRPDWHMRWRNAIRESTVGHPNPYIFHPTSSANLIHHAYHIARFEEKTNFQVQNLDFVFEFGGGYGSMCRLFFNLGFRGKYIIFDFPSFSALQMYYLKTLGLPVRSATELEKLASGIFCISDPDQLRTILGKPTSNNMFLATWSISESPINVRESILPCVIDFQSFLLAYQDRFEEVDNRDFFAKWKETVKHINWQNWQIEHIPGNSYLIGR